MECTVRWTGDGMTFLAETGSGHVVAMDGAPEGGGRNAEANFHGQKRSNETHASTTDPHARLYRKGPGKEAKLDACEHHRS